MINVCTLRHISSKVFLEIEGKTGSSAHELYDSPNGVKITVDCTKQSQREHCVFNYQEGSEAGKIDSWVRQCR